MILYYKYNFRKTKCFWCFSSAAFFSVEIFISSTSSLIVLYSDRRQFYLIERCNNPPARQRLQPACRPKSLASASATSTSPWSTAWPSSSVVVRVASGRFTRTRLASTWLSTGGEFAQHYTFPGVQTWNMRPFGTANEISSTSSDRERWGRGVKENM